MGESKFLSNPWYIGLSSFLGSVLSGIAIGFFFKVITPLWGVNYDMNLQWFDIVLPSSITHIVMFTFIGIFVGIYFAQTQILKYRNQLERKLALAERENLKNTSKLSKLNAIQANVNPHFLYNSLNSIAALIRTKSDKSEDMVIALSRLFRYHIIPDQAPFATLEQEVEILKTYLEIEKIRFGEQLNYDISVGENLNSIQLPRLLLQPIVENAIKHGTSKVESGTIEIKAREENENLIVEISDNGPAFGGDLNSGNGLNTVAKMLQLYYPEKHDLLITSAPKKQVKISIPIQK